ncbi:MAG: hypothetical protein JSV91_11580 [Phycisphaerales bacterium]|nr:MAG: hypothetical protein JSV91_11580 [Phycisphaerales bacterium]
MTPEEIIKALAVREGPVGPGSIAYQPLLPLGWKYHEPLSPADETYWLRVGGGPECCDGDRRHHTSEHVAEAIGVDVAVVRKWENAANLIAELEAGGESGP